MPSPLSGSRRFLPLVAAATVTFAVVVPSAAVAQHVATAEPPALSIDHACPEGFESPANDFDDIGNTGVHVRAIRCAAHHGITAGGPGDSPADRYGPGLDVTRGQMATFVARLLDLVGTEVEHEVLPPWDGENDFTDVRAGDPHVAAINRLADEGVVHGGPGGRPSTSFGPQLGVTRAQVASLLNRMHVLAAGGSFIGQEVYFDDLGGVLAEHSQNINALAEEGVLAGRDVGGERHYHPGATVRRDQMATLLMRELSLMVLLDVVGHTFTEPEPGSGAEPVVTPGFPESTAQFAQLVDVRLESHSGFDRFVLEFDGTEMPAHSVRYVAPPVSRAGSGEPVVLAGDAHLAVDVAGASGFDVDTGTQTYAGPRSIPLEDGSSLTEAEETGDFEGMLNWRLGVEAQRPFSVDVLTEPTRLVVEVSAP